MNEFDHYLVTGINPEPWQASEGSVGRKGGKTFVQFHKPIQLRLYQEALKKEFVEQNGWYHLYEGALEVVFYFWRLLSTADADGIKVRAHIADATNLQKATEDALQGLLYKNDRIIRSCKSVIVSQTSETMPSIMVKIRQHEKEELVLASIQRASMLPDSLDIAHQDSTRVNLSIEDVF